MYELHTDAALIREAAEGLEAVNRFVASRFDLADALETTVGPEAADEVREVWRKVADVLADPLRRSIEAELAGLRVAEPALM